MSTLVGVVFGGAGGVMLLGAVALFVQGEFGGAAGLGVFGLVFAGAGYGGYRVFREPEGHRRVLVAEETTSFTGPAGVSGRRTSRTYRYVDGDATDEAVGELKRRWATEPWTRRADWAEGRIVQEGPGSMRLLIGFTIAWNVIAWGIAGLAIGSEWGSDVPWFVLLFPAVGLALAVMTVRTWIRRRKFGTSVLTLDTVPAWTGGRLRGAVELGVPTSGGPEEGFRVRLRCVERRSYRDRDGDRHVAEEELWSTEVRSEPRSSGADGTLAVPIDIAVPRDLPPTEMLPGDDRVLWRVEISGSVPGVDYAAGFEVPVFRQEQEAEGR